MLKTFSKINSAGAPRFTSVSALFRRFRKERKGVAAVEFALLAPLLLTLMLGSVELTHALWGSGKLAKATNTSLKLVGATEKLTDKDFEDLVAAAPLVLRPYPQNDLTVVITSLLGCLENPNNPKSKMKYYVRWSRKWQGGNAVDAPYSVDSEFTKQPESLIIGDGNTLLAGESFYGYKPRIARKTGKEIQMGDIAFQQPRKDIPVDYPEAGQSKKTCEDHRS